MRQPSIGRLQFGEQRLLAEAILLLGFSCLALRLVSYRTLMRRLPAAGDRPPPPALVRATATAMRRASRLFGRDICLRQAVAAHIMFARRGYAASIGIGMRQGAGGRPEAHAWLVSGGFVVTGGTADELRGFVPFEPAGPA